MVGTAPFSMHVLCVRARQDHVLDPWGTPLESLLVWQYIYRKEYSVRSTARSVSSSSVTDNMQSP